MYDELMVFFKYDHLPANLQIVSRHFCELADYVDSLVPNNKEKVFALRKLLEAKDCAVRATLLGNKETI